MPERHTGDFQPGEESEKDSRLVLAAQRDPAAFQALYDRWVLAVYRYFYYRTQNAASAEDLTSQLFLTAYQSLPRYQHRGRFTAWLFTIAGNLFKQHYRKTWREMPLEQAQTMISVNNIPVEYIQIEDLQRLNQLVRALPEDEQELIRLRYVAELSFADISQVLNKSEDAVKKSLYRLQARLQSLLEQDHE